MTSISFTIKCFMGMPRSGKTISMVAEGYNTFLEIKDIVYQLEHKKKLTPVEKNRYDIFSKFELMSNLTLNKDIYGDYINITPEKLINMYEKKEKIQYRLILIDDIFKKFDSRDFMKKSNKIFSYFITEIGKMHNILLYVSHFDTLIEKRIKEMTEVFIICDKGEFKTVQLNGKLFNVFKKYDDYYKMLPNNELKRMRIRQRYLRNFIDIERNLEVRKKVFLETYLKAYDYFNHYNTGEVV